jgi:CubicO group peptidase (beta-lactamase class C family)
VIVNGSLVQVRSSKPDAQSPAGGMSASANDIAKWLTMILSNRVFNGKRVVDADALTAALSPESQTQPPGDGQGTSNHGSASMSANEL